MFASVATSTMILRRVETKGTFTRLVETFRLALAAYNQRSALAKLDDAMLADIGLNARQVDAEVNRPFWDVPATWRR